MYRKETTYVYSSLPVRSEWVFTVGAYGYCVPLIEFALGTKAGLSTVEVAERVKGLIILSIPGMVPL